MRYRFTLGENKTCRNLHELYPDPNDASNTFHYVEPEGPMCSTL